MMKAPRVFLIVALAFAAASCGGGGGGKRSVSNPSPDTGSALPTEPLDKEPVIAVVDTGVEKARFRHMANAGMDDGGGYFVNDEFAMRIPDGATAVVDGLERRDVESEIGNAWTPRSEMCPNLNTGGGRCAATHGELSSGVAFALRPQARLLSRRVRLGLDCDPDCARHEGDGQVWEAIRAVRAYNIWAHNNGGEKIRILSGSFTADHSYIRAAIISLFAEDANREMLLVFSAGNSGESKPKNPAGLPLLAEYSHLKTNIIAVAGADLVSSGDNAAAEETSIFYDGYNSCGDAKEWCISALARNVPTLEGLRFSGTSAAAPRVAATAAGVMRESGMTQGDAVQALIFKTAFKCAKVGSPNKKSAGDYATMELADILAADCNNGGDDEYAGYARINADDAGQGLLNYNGAIEEAKSTLVRNQNNEEGSRLSEAAFHSSAIFGGGVARQLADIDLELVAASGNRYRHRPPPAGLTALDVAPRASERVFAFGAIRQSAPLSVGGKARLSAHSQTPHRLEDNANNAAPSGFSYRRGAFSFSFDNQTLPGRFNAQTTLLPEAHFAPYWDFVRRGAELSYRKNQAGLSFAAAQGERADDYGDATAAIGVAAYRREFDNLSFTFSFGALQEDARRLLGAKTGGAFATSKAQTRFAGVRAEWRKNGDAVFAAAWRGVSKASPASGAIFLPSSSGGLSVNSESYAAGISSRDIFRKGDEATFAVFHPLRAFSGKARLHLPPNRGGDAQSQTLDLSAPAREYDISAAYRRRLGANGHIAVGALYRKNPAHRKTAPERLAALSLGWQW